MAILRSSHKVGNTQPQARPFDELLSRIGQRSQLAASKYEPSTQLAMAQVWDRWTVYVLNVGVCDKYTKPTFRMLTKRLRHRDTGVLTLTLYVGDIFLVAQSRRCFR
jgi:hypothetical protein